MKVKKATKVTSCNTLAEGISVEVNSIQSHPYEDAKNYIQSAISSLSSIAANDELAKDCIANLAVVLMDLQ